MKQALAGIRNFLYLYSQQSENSRIESTKPTKYPSFFDEHEHKFDIRAHYNGLKRNHPLYSGLHSQKENELKKTYMGYIDVSRTPKSACMTPKSNTPKKYGKDKLVKFKKAKEMNFKELYDKIKSIGS